MKNIIIVLIMLILLTSCADKVDVKECIIQEPYGFFSGLWHGCILLFSFIGSIYSNDIAVYAVNNTGLGYDFGFLLGAGVFGSASFNIKLKNG